MHTFLPLTRIVFKKTQTKKGHEDVFFFTKEWTFMAVLLFFLCCLFCCAAAGPSNIPAASAAVVVHGMYQAFFQNTRIFDQIFFFRRCFH
jgi:drug/metabolite transporter (DMT)-like permease